LRLHSEPSEKDFIIVLLNFAALPPNATSNNNIPSQVFAKHPEISYNKKP